MSPVVTASGVGEGLSEREAADRQRDEGPNELPSARPSSLWTSLLGVVREPMTALLIGCGALYFALGDRQEALMLMGFVLLITGITVYQERKTEHALEALRDLASPRALVIREGQRRRIAGRDVARGDLLVLVEGDRVPADALVLSTAGCSIDESLLTGESAPVRKAAWNGSDPFARPGGDDRPFVYSGTLVVQGGAIARAHAIGASTEMGRIGVQLRSLDSGETRLQRETKQLVWRIAILAGGVSILAAVLYGLREESWVKGVLAGLTLAMAVLPNEFPVVVTIFLALGAWRLSGRRVLARRTPAVETLGSATVLCVDKTGTLTENRMSVSLLYAAREFFETASLKTEPLPETFHPLIEYSILASRRDPFDPMELAFLRLGALELAGSEHLHPDWALVREYPLTRQRLAVTLVWQAPGSAPSPDRYVLAAKGAPETIMALCGLAPERLETLSTAAREMARGGLRVLAVGRAQLPATALPEDPGQLPLEFLGFVGLVDPLRESVPGAVRECRAAGIRVVVVSGDHPSTIEGIARQLGLEGEVMTGAQFAALTEEQLAQRVQEVSLYARVLPEQKLRLVQALRARGEIVAMTGDGVNDAPALKAANIGVAMGGRGTDVAREAAQLVLLDDDFASLEGAVRIGRRVIDNLKKALAYILAIHLPILGLTLIPIAFGWPLVLLPVHIAFLHLVIDPACSVVFEAEPEEENVMRRPPRPPGEPLFGARVLGLSLLQGSFVMLVCIGLYAAYRGRGGDLARSVAFATLVVANLGLVFVNLSWSQPLLAALRAPNPALWWVTAGTLALLGAILYVPLLRSLFGFSLLPGLDLLACLGAGVLSIAWFELLKRLAPRRTVALGRVK